MLAFRDWLRIHDDDRVARYERTKRDLAAREWKFVQHYADAKTEVVEAHHRAGMLAERADRALTSARPLGTLRPRMNHYFYFRCPA